MLFLALIFYILNFCNGQTLEYISPVLVLENRTPPLTYETTSKLHFRISYPNRLLEDVIATEFSPCNNTEAWNCRMQFRLQSLSQTIGLRHNFLQAPPSKLRNVQQSEICNKGFSHFSSLHTNALEIFEYVNQISNCLGAFVNIPATNFPAQDINSQYMDVTSDFSVPEWQGVNESYILPMIALNLGSFINTGFIHYLAEKELWNTAISDCRAGFIPMSLLPKPILQPKLEQLSTATLAKGYEFVIPPNDDDISAYYKLTLADCTFINNGSSQNELLIEISVPIIRRSNLWTHVNIVPIPFRYKYNTTSFICYVPDLEKTQQFAFNKATFPKNKFYYSVDCNGQSGPCFVPEISETEKQWIKTCTQFAIQFQEFEGETEAAAGVLEFCRLKCEPESKFNVPIFHQISSDTFVIIGDPSTGAIIQCDGGVLRSEYPPDSGALLLSLPCGCQVSFNQLQKVVSSPCVDKITVRKIQAINLQD